MKYGITHSDDEIAKLSKGKFRKLIEEKIKSFAIKYLQTLALKHSKSTNIAKEKFGRKGYFTDRRFSKEDIQLLFSLRTKMLDVKSNFQNQFENENFEDENHLLNCSVLDGEIGDEQFSDVYDDIDKQLSAVRIFKKIL